jgi:phage/plasmid-associated DNA primase
MDGNQYIPLGTFEIAILAEPQLLGLEAKIDSLCEGYMSDANKSEYIKWLENPDNWKSLGVGQGRHNALVILGTSYYYRYSNGWHDLTDDDRKQKLWEMNLLLKDPKPESEFNLIWKWIVETHRKKRDQEHEKLDNELRNKKTDKEEKYIALIEEATESILEKHKFATIEESDSIYHYSNGVYSSGGEVMVKTLLENLYGYDLNISKRAEIREHIKNKTYKKLSEFDSDINVINMANGLYNISTNEISPHSPNYFSMNQKPIPYDPNAPVPVQFLKFIKQIVYPSDVRTLIELMAYTFYRDNPFEIITTLNGSGSNGKSVLFGLLTALHGAANVSNVSLKTMVERPYGLYGLVGKDVNLDAELSSNVIYDTAILKKITGRQRTRVEEKNQPAFDTSIHAKLWLSANKIPQTVDETNAYFRRNVIIACPHTFEERDYTPSYSDCEKCKLDALDRQKEDMEQGIFKLDPDLIKKLTTPEELSGIFNLLMFALRRILKEGRIFLTEKTIQDRREKYEMAVNPIKAFLDTAVEEESLASDMITKAALHEAFKYFCNKHKLAVMSMIQFGKTIKEKFQEDRETTGKRRTVWTGIKLKDEYLKVVMNFNGRQIKLEDLV